MTIAIIGSGHIGSVLAKNLSLAGHRVLIGSRDHTKPRIDELKKAGRQITVLTIADAAKDADVIILAVPLVAVPEVASALGTVQSKIIIDTSNGFGKSIPGFAHGVAAIKNITGASDVIRCFNSIGAEDLDNPVFKNGTADAFVAGDSSRGKECAHNLARDLRFENCYDLGGDDAIPLLENLAMLWGSLAYKAGLGRRIAFKILKD